MTYASIVHLIGDTPLIELSSFSPRPGVRIYAKLEGSNPGGSIKDRIALFMLQQAMASGVLASSRHIIEATSGNTGIALAMLCSIMGFHFTAVMPDNASQERRSLLQAYGASLVLTDGSKGTNYSIQVARDLVQKSNGKAISLDQFNNTANPMAHFHGTGQEILHDCPGITHFIAGIGTGGTISGVGKRLKKRNPDIKVYGVEPGESVSVEGLRNLREYSPAVLDLSVLDEKLILPSSQSAIQLAQELFQKEGLSVGISSGAALWGALEVARELDKARMVIIFPDRGDKYYSTELFRFESY